MNDQLICNLQTRMAHLGLSMNELSRRAGLSQTAVFDIVNSRANSPRLATLEKLAGALGTTVTELLQAGERAEAERRILEAFALLPKPDQERLLRTAEAWLVKAD